MKAFGCACLLIACAALSAVPAFANDYSDTAMLFRKAGTSAAFFGSAYGYAIFPTIGKGGFYIGAAHGDGRVYEQGRYVGNTSMTQISFGFQLGGQAYSEIIFFQNKGAFDRFTAGNFAFSGNVSAVAITASASASAGTTGSTATASSEDDQARTAGAYHDGLAVFTIAKGGLMYEAAVAGQKFSYRPLH